MIYEPTKTPRATPECVVTMSSMEYDATVAALRLLAREIENGNITPDDGDVGMILTNAGLHGGLSFMQVDELCDDMLAGRRDPR